MFVPLLFFFILCPFSLLLSVLYVERNRGLTARKTLSNIMQRCATVVFFFILCPFSLLLSVLYVERNRGLTARKTLSNIMQRCAAVSQLGYKRWEHSNVSINSESRIGKSLVAAVIDKHDVE